MLSHNSKNHADSHRKKHLVLWIVTSLLLIILILPILVLGWLGFVPGLSSLMGSSKPRDLGVTYNAADLDSYKAKTAIQLLDTSQAPSLSTSPDETTNFTNLRTVDNLELTDNELTAAINNTSWSWLPIDTLQARFSNGSIELSGKLNADKLPAFRTFISNGGSIDPSVDEALVWAGRLSNNAPFYAKANAVISDNSLDFQLTDAEIGRLDIPLGEIRKETESGATYSNIGSQYLNVQSARLVEGKLIFSGTYPSTIYLKK